ncbi:MAG TPA: 3-dehydroquinate synthase [Bacteroidales bacterium]|nr:3-dehydroquinate synthase [Bacteroidales bacterium]
MESIIIRTPVTESEIRIGEAWENVSGKLPSSGVVLITDDNLKKIYGSRFPDFPVLSIRPGEESKSLETAGRLSAEIMDLGIDRSGFILAIGGGVVSDLAGFIASIYMRGIRCGYVSSSLLSQVDASTGGKNGVNLGGVKNILGVIRQPEFVICDPRMLLSLSEDEYLSGMAELIKTAIIGDTELFGILEEQYAEIKSRNVDLLELLVTRAVRFKARVVTEDEDEKGLRRILNFGHTFGHAFEAGLAIKHGFAVASGMVLASAFSVEKGFCSEEDNFRIISLLKKFGFQLKQAVTPGMMEKLILHDKKKAGSDIFFVFNKGIGDATFMKIPVGELSHFYSRQNI